MRRKNADKLAFAHIYINSLRNKFKLFGNQVKENINVLMNSETKIDDNFPLGNFLIDDFSKPYKLDYNSLGEGILLKVRI